MAADKPQVSIIVPTRNEERNLPRLVRSVASQLGVAFELIVVDQSSDDRTREIARGAGATVIVRPRPEYYSPPSQSRNVGAERASANILLHLDADMELPDVRFLERFVMLFDERHQAAIVHELDVAQGWWSRVKATERMCYWNTGIECARGVTRRLFWEVGGYHAAISSGEDMHIHRLYSQRTTIARSDLVWLRHVTGHLHLKRLLAKKYNYGRTAITFLEQSQNAGGYSATEWAKECLLAYVTHLRVAAENPALFACIFPLRFAELVALRLGMHKASKDAVPRRTSANT